MTKLTTDEQAAFDAAQKARRDGADIIHAMKRAGVYFQDPHVLIDQAAAEHAALVKLLIDRGVFTRQDYLAAVADAMTTAVDRFKAATGIVTT
jgi:hypothetical protein